MSVVVVLPSIHRAYTEACLATIDPTLIDVGRILMPAEHQPEPVISIINGQEWDDGKPRLRFVTIWNTPKHNLGVASSWNVGIKEVVTSGYDWLVILSAGVRFGPKGARDFLGWLPDIQDERPDLLGVEAGSGLGWHLLAFPRHVLERVGYFDPIFYPAYMEDLDYSRRIQLVYDRDSTAPDFVGPLWPKVEVDARLEMVAHGIKSGGVAVDFQEIERLYVAKWGAKSPAECYRTPYNDPALTIQHIGPRPL